MILPPLDSSLYGKKDDEIASSENLVSYEYNGKVVHDFMDLIALEQADWDAQG